MLCVICAIPEGHELIICILLPMLGLTNVLQMHILQFLLVTLPQCSEFLCRTSMNIESGQLKLRHYLDRFRNE